jgi:hypothetical protein
LPRRRLPIKPRRRRLPARAPGQPWQIVPQPQSSLVYARDGSLIGEMGRESRTSVPIRTLPKYVGQAFVAVEDQRFYQHDGVDLIGVAGAIKGKLLDGITGVTAAARARSRSSSWEHAPRPDRPPGSEHRRKLREQQAAREMERHYTRSRSSRRTSTRSTSGTAGTAWSPRPALLRQETRRASRSPSGDARRAAEVSGAYDPTASPTRRRRDAT